MSTDAVKFMKERNRMCKASTACAGCALSDKSTDPCSKWCFDHPEEAVAAVEGWVSEHPAKTRQSEFLKQWPTAELDCDGLLLLCPLYISDEYRCDSGCANVRKHCADCRREFWNQEVE